MSPSIFISYSSKDKPFARKLATDLRNRGARVWLDDFEIMVGDSFIEKIQTGIDEMEYLAVVLSPNSVGSQWVKREVDVAMNQEIDGKSVKVLPLLLQQCNLPGFLKGKRYADFTAPERYQDSLTEILRRLGLSSIPMGSDEESVSFHELALDRLQGRPNIGTRLISMGTKERWRAVARLELAYHEFSRQREHKALETMRALTQVLTNDPFVLRAFALLEALCYVARGDTEATRRV